MGAIEDRALSQQVNDLLLEQILHSRLKPGQRLRESTLAEELGVSRTPIREALKSLAASGFVAIKPRRGVFVSDIDATRLEEILELRHLLEMYAAKRGLERISQKDLREMRSLVERSESVADSTDWLEYEGYVDVDRDLHRLIIGSCGNGLLTEFYERLAVFLQMARVRLFESTPNIAKGHEEHKLIVRAYETRDRDLLLQVLESHLERSRNEILEVAAGRRMSEAGAE